MEENYEELEGKVVDFVRWNDEVVRARVIGVDPDIGLTLVREDDHNLFLVCLLREGSPQWKEHNYKRSDSGDKIFNSALSQIKEGIVNAQILINMQENSYASIGITQDDCAFGA